VCTTPVPHHIFVAYDHGIVQVTLDLSCFSPSAEKPKLTNLSQIVDSGRSQPTQQKIVRDWSSPTNVADILKHDSYTLVNRFDARVFSQGFPIIHHYTMRPVAFLGQSFHIAFQIRLKGKPRAFLDAITYGA
jgi:hypothetical protein